MLFNSFVFIFVFLPIVFIIYFLLNRFKLENLSIYWLVVASFVFYSYNGLEYIALMLMSIVVNFIIGKWLNKPSLPKKKLLLAIGIIFNILVLGYYKYVDFFISNINILLGSDIGFLHLALPLGISFVTFQQIGYLMDSYHGTTAHYKIGKYALFIMFFPQLIAGPIVNHSEMMPQYDVKENRRIRWENVSTGVYIFIIGLTKKVAIADTVAVWANDGYSNYTALTTAEAWITSLSYTMQLYFDFSGYCDMAIGLALMFNIKLPVNFFSPYKARNIQQFWKQWHMTLNRFLTAYLYFPLGGSRKGKFRTYVNILIIFFVSGFWHGAGWTFIIWGMLHGIASVIVRLWGKTKIQLPYIVSWFITFQFVNAAWVYFRATSVEQANHILKLMYTPDLSSFKQLLTQPLEHFATAGTFTVLGVSLGNVFVILITLFILMIIVLFAKNSIQLLENFKFNWRTIIGLQFLMALVLITVFYMQKNSEFLYFNF